MPSIVKRVKSTKYKPYEGANDKYTVTVVVSVYHEDSALFELCLKAIKENIPDELITIIDDPSESLKLIAEKYADKIIYREGKQGKRSAVALSVTLAKGDIIAFIDSDCIMKKNCIKEFVKPFDDSKVGLVATVHDSFSIEKGKIGSYLSWRLSQQIEKTRTVNNKALNGHIVVADGTCYVFRKHIIEKYLDDYQNNDIFLNIHLQSGEDRYLTYRANMDGWKTVIQSTAQVDAAAPKTFKGFIKQQLRWLRSGKRAYLREISTNLFRKTGMTYGYHVTTYYLSTISFMIALIVDPLFFHLSEYIPLYAIPFLVLSGSTMINMVRQLIMLGREANLFDAFWFGTIGLFVMFPLGIYSWLTIHKESWSKLEEVIK